MILFAHRTFLSLCILVHSGSWCQELGWWETRITVSCTVLSFSVGVFSPEVLQDNMVFSFSCVWEWVSVGTFIMFLKFGESVYGYPHGLDPSGHFQEGAGWVWFLEDLLEIQLTRVLFSKDCEVWTIWSTVVLSNVYSNAVWVCPLYVHLGGWGLTSRWCSALWFFRGMFHSCGTFTLVRRYPGWGVIQGSVLPVSDRYMSSCWDKGKVCGRYYCTVVD